MSPPDTAPVLSPNQGRNHWFEEFEVGKTYPTASRRVTLEDQLAFCRLVGYEVPMFLDENVGKQAGYDSLISPSHLIMSFTTSMTGALFSQSIVGLLAIENARFLKPVRPGDTLRTEVEVISKRLTKNPARGVVTFRDHVYNQHGEEVFHNDKIALIACRPQAAPQP